MYDEIPTAGFREWLNWLLGRRYGVTIDGDSMLPILRQGDRVFVEKNAKVNIDDIVLACHPFKSDVRIVKRIISVDPDGSMFLKGDNTSESSDSRVFGAIAQKNLIGKVVSRIR